MADRRDYVQVLGFVAHVEQTDRESAPTEGGQPLHQLRRTIKTWGDSFLPKIFKRPPDSAAPEGPSPAPPSSRAPHPILYALLPRIDNFKDLAQLFTQNGLHVLSTEKLSPSLLEAARAGKLEVMEMAVRVGERLVDSSGKFLLFVEPSNKDFLSGLLAPRITEKKLKIVTLPDGNFPGDPCMNQRPLKDDINFSILKKLVTVGPDIKYRHKDGGTLLHFAVRARDERTVALLVSCGASVDATTRDDKTPLLLAVDTYTWSIDIINCLLKKGANVNAADDEGVTPFLVTLRMHKATDLPVMFLNKGGDVNSAAPSGSALKFAAKAGPHYLSQFLTHGLDSSKNQQAFREVFKDADSGNSETLRMLSDYGFQLQLQPEDAEDVELLHAALRMGDYTMFEDLLRWGAFVYRSRGGTDAMKDLLSRAVSSRNPAAIECIFKIDDIERSSYSFALVKAIGSGNTRILKSVLQVGDLRLDCIFSEEVLESLEPADTSDSDYEEQANATKNEMRTVVCRHVVLIATADLKVNEEFFSNRQQFGRDELPEWVLESLPPAFLEECTAEVTFLKALKVGDSTYTFYDVLNSNMSETVRLLKNPVIRDTLRSRSFETEFPWYWPLIDSRVRRADYRRTLIDRGVKVFGFLSQNCEQLPFELRERIFRHLRNHELLVLIEACGLEAGKIGTPPS